MLKVVNLRTRRCPQLIGRIGGPHRWLWLLTIVNHLIRRFTVMSNCATIKPLKVSSWNKVVDNDRSTILKRAEGAPLVKLWAFYKIFAGFKFKHKIKFDLPDWRYRIWKITPHVTIFWKIRHHLTMMVRRKNILFFNWSTQVVRYFILKLSVLWRRKISYFPELPILIFDDFLANGNL